MIKGIINPQSKYLNDNTAEILTVNGEIIYPVFEDDETIDETIFTAEVFNEEDFEELEIEEGVFAG